MRPKRISLFLLASSCLFLLLAACIIGLYGALTFSPERHFHCCEPFGWTFAQVSAVVLPLPVLLALAGIFGWASLRTGRVPATLLHLTALLLLGGHALLLGAGAYASQGRALQVVARNFQLVRDCRTDWLVERLQAGLGCSGWNQTTAHRSVCPPAGLNGSAAAAAAAAGGGPCRERVSALTARMAAGALGAGVALALLTALSLGCQCAYQWKISDPNWRDGKARRQRQSAAAKAAKTAGSRRLSPPSAASTVAAATTAAAPAAVGGRVGGCGRSPGQQRAAAAPDTPKLLCRFDDDGLV